MTSTVPNYYLYIVVEHGIAHQLGQPRGLVWFHLQGDHPSEAELVVGF